MSSLPPEQLMQAVFKNTNLTQQLIAELLRENIDLQLNKYLGFNNDQEDKEGEEENQEDESGGREGGYAQFNDDKIWDEQRRY